MRVLLNIDLGELPDEPEALWEAAHLANVACCGHAGDEVSMRRSCELALRFGTALGAHPSYEDRDGFGRRALPITPVAIGESILRQCTAFARIAAEFRLPVHHVKPHGALYHSASKSPEIAAAVVQAARTALGPVKVLAPPGSELLRAGATAGLELFPEGFADRGLRGDGTLIPRGEPGALIEDPALAAAQAWRLAATGRFATLCVHGDTPNAVAIARAVREALEGA